MGPAPTLCGSDDLTHKYAELLTFERGKILVPLHLPLSQQAHAQMAQVQRDLHEITLNDMPDSWSYIWNFRTFFQ